MAEAKTVLAQGLVITTSTGDVDLTAKVRSLEINFSGELVDMTAMTDGTRKRARGLFDWSATASFNQDYDDNQVDTILWSLANESSASTITMRVESTVARGATNPEYSGSAFLEGYNPASGAVGDGAIATATFMANGPLSRTITST